MKSGATTPAMRPSRANQTSQSSAGAKHGVVDLSSSRALLIIDDRRLRKLAFAQAEKLIKRLERIEADLRAFETDDQQLYSNWYELTFRVERNKINELHAEYRRLTQFHNWMVAEAKRQDISIAEAHAFLSDEAKRFIDGSDQDRLRIEADRSARERYIESEIEKEYEAERARHAKADERSRKAQAKNEFKFEAIRKATDDEIAEICRSRTRAIDLIGSLLESANQREHLSLLLRVWNLTSTKNQREFKDMMFFLHGVDFDEMLESIYATLGIDGDRSGRSAKANRRDPSAAADLSDDQDEREAANDEFNSDYIDSNAKSHRMRNSAEDAELVKILYRKLVRRLHPDLQGGQGEIQSPWQKQIWNRVQDANLRQDLRELEKLFRIVLIRGRELSEITMGEILESQTWLHEEIAQINRQVKQNKSAPAWGFSRRKDYGPLKRKVEKSIMMELLDISDEVDELKAEHEFLEMLARSERSSHHLEGARHARRTTRPGSAKRRSGRSSGRSSGRRGQRR